MRLTLSTDYALRTLIYVGARGEAIATIAEVAQSFGVSKTHLMKVVNRLARQGYLETVRGKGGGLRLGRAASTIRVGDVVRDVEDDLAVMGCLASGGEFSCRIQGCCVLRRALAEATRAFLAVLDDYTVADLLAPSARLARSLGLGRGARRAAVDPGLGSA